MLEENAQLYSSSHQGTQSMFDEGNRVGLDPEVPLALETSSSQDIEQSVHKSQKEYDGQEEVRLENVGLQKE